MCLHIDAMVKHLNLDMHSLILKWEGEVPIYFAYTCCHLLSKAYYFLEY
jgi:hypothetical protein